MVENQERFMDQQTMQSHQIPTFAGLCEPSAEDWIERVQLIQKSRSWEDGKMYRDVRLVLVEPAFSAVLKERVQITYTFWHQVQPDASGG